jgi:DNA-binding CsgD family transcriptional regulator
MFHIGSCEVRINELLLSELDLERFQKMSKNIGLIPEIKELRNQLHREILNNMLEDNKILVMFFKEFSKSIIEKFDYSCIIMLANADGVVLDIERSHNESDCPIAIGSSLAVQSAGIDAVSAAILLNRAVYMEKGQHYLHIFNNWACICLPIYDKTGETIAYIDFSTSPDLEISVYYPFICLMAKTLEFQMQDQVGCLIGPESKFLNYKLTPRQREIAALWISGKDDYKSIANKLHISDKTVRTIIVEVYRKLNVHSKSEMMYLFLMQ